ncbi:MAG: hypothetical protein GY866_33670, partial [Proteobacteria bacterium]|nr:hypothetical protein [Pseudomonadota bacterium]
MTMTSRERLIATVEFEAVDRPFRWETIGYWEETIKRWHGEGLPEEVSDDVNFYLYNEFDLQIPVLLGSSEHAGFDPLFEEEIVERNGNQTLKRDFTGSLVKVFTDGSSTPPHFIDFPITDRESWEQVKPRLDPDTPGRLEPYGPFIDMAKENPWPLI